MTRGLPEDQRPRAAALYWEAFRGKLGRIMAPEAKAQALFASSFDPAFAISALTASGDLLGLAGFKTAQGSLLPAGMSDMARVYGWPGALWRGPVLGLLDRKPAADALQMDGIFVAKGARGLGIGGKLLQAVSDEARDRGLDAVLLEVIDTNPRARALYARQGFAPVKETRLGPLSLLFGFACATTMRRPVVPATVS